MIFDGQATVYSTCRACHQIMQVIDPDESVHPTCEPRPTKLESLAMGYKSALDAGDDAAAELTAKEIDKIENQPPQPKKAALWYAGWGWPVFGLRQVGTQCSGGDKCKPLCQCPKEPATEHGFKNATTDVAAIEKFWRPYTHYNVGLATGHLFDVIDIDPRHGGNESFQKLLQDKAIPVIHGVAVTASGGLHLYVKAVQGRSIATNVRPGIDYRGRGGYVVAPPSTLGPRERSWSWMTVPSPVIKGGNS